MASSNIISGIGLAKTKTISSLLIVLIISVATKLAPENPMNISTLTKTSTREPFFLCYL